MNWADPIKDWINDGVGEIGDAWRDVWGGGDDEDPDAQPTPPRTPPSTPVAPPTSPPLSGVIAQTPAQSSNFWAAAGVIVSIVSLLIMAMRK